MNADAGKEQALLDLADACARLAVAAGATPGEAVSSMLTPDAPLLARRTLRRQYEAVQRQAKRSNNLLFKRYSAAIEQANLLMGVEWPHIDPAVRPSEMSNSQRLLCAETALNCARNISGCGRLLPDTVGRLAAQRKRTLERIEETNIDLRESLARLSEADSLLQSLIAQRYLENSQTMNPVLKRRLQTKFIHALDSGDRAIADLLAATSRHARLDDELIRTEGQIAALFGHDLADISHVANHAVSDWFLRRHPMRFKARAFPSDAAIADLRRCTEAAKSTRMNLAQMRQHAIG